MTLNIEPTLDYMAISPDEIWELLRATHPELLPDTKQVDLYGSLHTAVNFSRAIKKSGKPHYSAEFSEGRLDYGSVGTTPKLSQIFIEGCVYGADDAWAWVRPLSELREFRASRVYDDEYEFWQNAADPIQYKGSGRSYAGLPMKSNGLPYSVEQMVIDTSANPGRRIFRQGYVEAIGAIMWLGEQFWSLTGARKQDVLAEVCLTCEELPNGVLRVQGS